MTKSEKKAIELFNAEFGRDIESRFKKVSEEFKETKEALKIYMDGKGKGEYLGQTAFTRVQHLEDEISDLYATVSHLASLMGLYHSELLEMAMDKVTKRKNDKNYKRF